MKLLHSADWHLDSPLTARSDAQSALLRRALLSLPAKVCDAAKSSCCDMLLLSGDLFDGKPTSESLNAMQSALEEVRIPVFIAPGNHDFYALDSPWACAPWSANVHIFTRRRITSVALPELNCRVYGAAFTDAYAPALPEGFRASGEERYHIGVLHGDPTQTASPYCPVTAEQIAACALDYLALGHIHKGGSLRAGKTLCAWPGCPMGRGFDELGAKGVLLVTVDNEAKAEMLPLDTPRFFDLQAHVDGDPADAVAKCLPAAESEDFYRITLTGECETPDLQALARRFLQFPNLELRDRTQTPVALWEGIDEDNLEGAFFRRLYDRSLTADESERTRVLLAAEISRRLLLGQEVTLP